MYYTDYTKTEIFTDRQTALNSSRRKAKDVFFNTLVDSSFYVNDDGEVMSYIVRLASDFQDIKKIISTYEETRELVYEVQIGK